MNSSTNLPITFRTVSEFRHARASKASTEIVLDAAPPADDIETIAKAEQEDSFAIKSALHFFDAECNMAAPTSFNAENNNIGSPALSEFMNRAVDFESAFEYAAEAPQATHSTIPLPSKYKNELQEDDGNGVCLPMNQADVETTQELLVPDEPTLASCRFLDQASVLKDPQEASSTGAAIELDEAGRVCKALFGSGESVCFSYNEQGELCEFNYAGIQWKKEGECWTANDRQTDYLVDGQISVLDNGSIRIEREDVVRILKLSGTRIDEHKSGSRTESRKLKNKPSPYDLLAKAKAVNSIWLNARPSVRHSAEHTAQAAPLKLDLLDQQKAKQHSNPMIPSVAEAHPFNASPANLTCVPSAPIELRSMERSDKLRSLEDQLLDQEDKQPAVGNAKLRIMESWLKSSLWITDRVVGQSSPKHLIQLDQLAELYFEQQRNDLAELTHLRALHIREQFYGKGQPELAVSISGLARIYETRANYVRAEEMYKEAISLQESGLRKVLFLYSEKVIDSVKLVKQIDAIFASISDLSKLYSRLGKAQQCAVVHEKAIGLAAEIAEREPAAAENELKECIDKHLEEMKLLSV